MLKKLYIEQGAVLERTYHVVAQIGSDFPNLDSQSYIEFISIVGRNFENIEMQDYNLFQLILEHTKLFKLQSNNAKSTVSQIW